MISEKRLFRNDFVAILYDMDNEPNKSERSMGRILGIDYGTKRIGIAISDEGRQFAMPLTVIGHSPELGSEIEKIALDNEAKEIVLGESRDYKGKPNKILLDSMEFKDDLESRGFTVTFEPEFMTSVQAERFQGKTEMSDASAAALILQSYLDRNKEEISN